MKIRFQYKSVIVSLVLSLFFTFCSFANNDSLIYNAKIIKLNLTSQIDPAARRSSNKAFELAKKENAKAIIIEMNTPGGLLNEADSIRTKIINSEIPVFVLIDPNAASAGALISIACNKIYMSDGSTIGAATVVTQNAEALPDKYQSYMRAMMRSTAEFRGRNPEIAEAMVDQNLDLDSLAPKGQVLTLTRSEAIEVGYCDGKAETIEQVLEAEGFRDFSVVELKMTGLDKIINFLISPLIHGLLILVIIGGIYYELQSPGIGFPLAAAITAAVLYFAPLYLESLAASWEILIFILGLGLLAVEIFVIPGFGIAGISGIILVLAGLILALVQNIYFDFTFAADKDILKAMVVVVSSFIISIVLIFVSGRQMIRSKLFQKLVLHDALQKPITRADKISSPVEVAVNMVGKTGKSLTPMHPSGKVTIDGDVYYAITEGEYIDKDTGIIVIEDHNNKLVIRKS